MSRSSEGGAGSPSWPEFNVRPPRSSERQRAYLRFVGSLALAATFMLLAAIARAQPDGSPKWPAPFVTGGYIVSSPAIAPDGTVYVGTQDKYLYAIAPNGTLKWRFLTGDWVDATPAIAPDGTVYVGSWDGKLYALTPAGGKKWEFATGAGNYIYSSPALGADGTIYFGAGDGNFYALRPDGTLKWTYPAGDWIDSSPAIGRDGLIYYGSWDAQVYALRDEGTRATEVWRYATNGPVLASPAVSRDGTVYVGSNDGRLHALDGATGMKRWEFLAEGNVESSPAIGPDGTVYFGGATGNLHAINPDGTLKWNFSTGDAVISTPAVRADGTILIGSNSAALFAVNPDGTQKWKVTTGDWVDASPVVAGDGTIYVGSYDRKLYAFHGTTSPPSAFSSWPMFRRDAPRAARTPAPLTGGRLVNLSTRAEAGAAGSLIAGFVVAGASEKPFLVRAVGPTLAQFGVSTPLADPRLELHTTIEGRATVLLANNNWADNGQGEMIAAAALKAGAFPLGSNSLDAALLATVAPRPHSALVIGSGNAAGIALVEVYDADVDNAGARLVNLSTRAHAGAGDRALTPGLVIGGTEPLRLLVRGVGPTLSQLGVTGALARPSLTLFSGSTAIASNTGWTSTNATADLRGAAQAVGAFPLSETSADSALLVTLAPGPYTVRVAGVGDTTGEALVEVYVVP